MNSLGFCRLTSKLISGLALFLGFKWSFSRHYGSQYANNSSAHAVDMS